MKKILVATNLGPHSRYALERALLLARSHNAILHVVHVPDEGEGAASDLLARQVDEAIERLECDLEDEFGAGFVPASIRSIPGDAVATIINQAASIGADLLVAGLTERPVWDRSLDGTILEQLLLATGIPLIVVKTTPTSGYEKVLVGLDFSPSSRNALETALKVAPWADFVIAHATENLANDSNLHGRLDLIARKAFAAARREVGVHYGALDIYVDSGAVPVVLKHHADRLEPQLVAFGKHNKGATVGPYLGSGARGILEKLDADMLVATSLDG